jgi:hypothetical protein
MQVVGLCLWPGVCCDSRPMEQRQQYGTLVCAGWSVACEGRVCVCVCVCSWCAVLAALVEVDSQAGNQLWRARHTAAAVAPAVGPSNGPRGV